VGIVGAVRRHVDDDRFTGGSGIQTRAETGLVLPFVKLDSQRSGEHHRFCVAAIHQGNRRFVDLRHRLSGKLGDVSEGFVQ
jgi:hypothetical protein